MSMQGPGGGGWGAGGGGGYGPPPGGAPGAPPQGGYGAPPQGGYGAPPQGGYGAPPQGGYGAPPQGGYGAPPQGGYGAPPQGGFGAPPGGGFGGPPGGGFGGPPGAPQPGARVITERNGAVVILLSIVTCGIYRFFHIYNTSDELRRATNDQSINPTTDVLLAVVTCTAWGWYTDYRNAQKVHAFLAPRAPHRKDQSQMILIMYIVSLFVGVTSLVGMFLAQEELNALAREGY